MRSGLAIQKNVECLTGNEKNAILQKKILQDYILPQTLLQLDRSGAPH